MGLCISVAKKIQPLKINGTTITQDESVLYVGEDQMKTETTKRMEQALIDKYLQQNKHIALEVPFCHTRKTNFGYGEVGQWEFVDAVSESRGEFTCLELKVSMSDLHSKAAQTFVGNRNYLVCPMKMARKIKDSNDYWLADHPSVGIMGWDGKTTFRVIKQCKPNYLIPDNDWKQLAKGLISSLSRDVKDMRNNKEFDSKGVSK